MPNSIGIYQRTRRSPVP